MPVSDAHAEYEKYKPRWDLVRDCVEGAPAIKSRNDGKTYLPQPNPDDTSAENKDRYTSYKTRANFVNFTGHTKKGMVGMVFRKETTIELPESINYLVDNANGGGLTLDQMIRAILSEVTETARNGLLVDYPAAEEGLTKAQVQARKLQANILPYTAESVINWRVDVINGIKKLTLVVLVESVEKVADDGFGVENVDNYRVLRLRDGVYTQQLYNEDEEPISEEFEPKKSDGSKWDEIPFLFIGSENNDETVDEAPLHSLAEVNIAHYRNSADYEESSFIVGQPTPVLAGLTQGWVDDVLKGKVVLGSRGAIPLPEGGSAMLLQASPNQMPLEGMRIKEEQMIKIGARVIQDSGGTETAEAAKIRFAGQNSELGAIVGNIESGLMQCFEWVSMYMGGEGEYILEINRQFYDASLDSQQVMALIQLADRGDISQTDLRSTIRKAGWIDSDKTDEDIDDELDGSSMGLTLENPDIEQQGTDPQLIEILNKIAEAMTQTYIPADSSGSSGGNVNGSPYTITVEAPIVNVTLPEGLITLPENMITVQVDAPSITVESPNITLEGQSGSPLTVNNQVSDKDIKLVYENGLVMGAESRAVENN